MARAVDGEDRSANATAAAIVTTLVDVNLQLRALTEVFQSRGGITSANFPDMRMGIEPGERLSAFAVTNPGPEVSVDWEAGADFDGGYATVSPRISLSWQRERGAGGEWCVESTICYRTRNMDYFEDLVEFPDFYCADSTVAMTVLKERLRDQMARLPDCIERVLDGAERDAMAKAPPEEWDLTPGTPQDAKFLQMIVATSFLLTAAVEEFVVKKTTGTYAAWPRVTFDRVSADTDDAVAWPSVRWVLTGNAGQSADVDIELALVALEDRFRGQLVVRHMTDDGEWTCESQGSFELTTVSSIGLWLEEMVNSIRERLRRRPRVEFGQ